MSSKDCFSKFQVWRAQDSFAHSPIPTDNTSRINIVSESWLTGLKGENKFWSVTPSVPVSENCPTLVPYPIEVFEMELLEDGVSAFQLVPSHSPEVWQQLVPLLST